MTTKCRTVGQVFSITCEGSYKASELVARGKYDWSDDRITDKQFPIPKHAPATRTLKLVKFKYNPTLEEVLAAFACRGLERPTGEDALYFGIEHPDEQRKHRIVFFHEPIQDPRGRRLLVLHGSAGRRDLLLWPDGRWPRPFVFAAVRPSQV